jgi:hypothetical protein
VEAIWSCHFTSPAAVVRPDLRLARVLIDRQAVTDPGADAAIQAVVDAFMQYKGNPLGPLKIQP